MDPPIFDQLLFMRASLERPGEAFPNFFSGRLKPEHCANAAISESGKGAKRDRLACCANFGTIFTREKKHRVEPAQHGILKMIFGIESAQHKFD